jgi:glycolate dehydrogenase FAD-binding subunit
MTGVSDLSPRLEKLVGGDRVRTDDSALQEFAIDGSTPMAVIKPRTAEEAAKIVSFAAAEKLALVPCGSRSKLELGMPPQRYHLALDMTDIRQLAHYDPGDLTVSVDAGMPLGELARVLAAKNQFLPLSVSGFANSTVGGAVASGIDSTLRQHYGTARDFLIGAEFVDGTGRQCKSGGRVVKNVAGYDLHKLLIGSLGTLGVITRLNFRTFPLPDLRITQIASFSTLEMALKFRTSLLGSGLPFSNLELIDPEFSVLLVETLMKTVSAAPALAAGAWHVCASFEGSPAMIQRIQREIWVRSSQTQALSNDPPDPQSSQQLGDALRDAFEWLRTSGPSVVLLRIVLPQFNSGDITELRQFVKQSLFRSAFALRACNVAYLALLAGTGAAQADAAVERTVSDLLSHLRARKGSATLLQAPRWLKAQVNTWGANRADFSLMQRVKAAFDPHNILAPGRFVGGI